MQRCGWCSTDPLYIAYHDQEWGRPLYDESALFELLCLEGQQAGLSWITVLKKRSVYRQHFFQYPIAQIAEFSDAHLQSMLSDAGLIRHIGKLHAIRDNAKAWLALRQAEGDVVRWLWQFVDQRQIVNPMPDYRLGPARSEASIRMSKVLKKNGFKFVGPTTCYAFMQSSGMVNDHEDSCAYKVPNPIN